MLGSLEERQHPWVRNTNAFLNTHYSLFCGMIWQRASMAKPDIGLVCQGYKKNPKFACFSPENAIRSISHWWLFATFPLVLSHTRTRPISISNIHRTATSATRAVSRSLGKYMADLMYVNVIKHLNMKYDDEHTYSPAVGCWPKLPSYLRKPPSACCGARGSRWVLWSCARAHNRYLNGSNYRRTAGKADVVSQQTSSQMCATPHSCLIITSVQRRKVQLERFWRNKESRAAIKWHSTEREVYASKSPPVN